MDKLEIIEIHYNFSPAYGDGRECWGEQYEKARVGEAGVTEIIEHPAIGEGDRWFYDIHHEDGGIIRLFNPCKVLFKPNS